MLELGYMDTLLERGEEAPVRSLDPALNSETGTLCSFDGKEWSVMMNTGPHQDQIVYIPSLSLCGHGGTVP